MHSSVLLWVKMASQEKRKRPKPPVPIKSQAVLALSNHLKSFRSLTQNQYHSDSEIINDHTSESDLYDDIIPYRLAVLSKESQPLHLVSSSSPADSERRKRKKPKLPPKPNFAKLTCASNEDIYDDVVVYRMREQKSLKPLVAPKPNHLQAIPKRKVLQPQTDHGSPGTNVATPASTEYSEQAEDIYTDASSIRPGGSTPQSEKLEHTVKPQNHEQHYETSGPEVSTWSEDQTAKYNLPYTHCSMPEIDPSVHMSSHGPVNSRTAADDEATSGPGQTAEYELPYNMPEIDTSVGMTHRRVNSNSQRTTTADNARIQSFYELDEPEGFSTNVSTLKPAKTEQHGLKALPPNHKQAPELELPSWPASDYELPYNIPERDHSESVPVGPTSSFGVETSKRNEHARSHSGLDDNHWDQTTSASYDYPQFGPAIKESPQHKQDLKYDYTAPVVSLTTNADSTGDLSPSHGVFVERQYDYAYQLPASPRLSPKPEVGEYALATAPDDYDYIKRSDLPENDPISSPAPAETSDNTFRVEDPSTSADMNSDTLTSDSVQVEGGVNGSTTYENLSILSGFQSSSSSGQEVDTTPHAQKKKEPNIHSKEKIPTLAKRNPEETVETNQHSTNETEQSANHRHQLLSKSHTLPTGRTKFDPLPDLFDQYQDSGDSDSEYEDVVVYEHIEPEGGDHEGEPSYQNLLEAQAQSLELPKQIRRRTTRLVRGPTKKKLHQTIKQRKNIKQDEELCASGAESSGTQPQSDESRDGVLVSSGELKSSKAAVDTQAGDSDDDYQSIPFGKSQEVFDMLLEASGIHRCSNTTPSHARRHSLSSSETAAELQSSVSSGLNYLESTEFGKLRELVYKEFREYTDAGIVHVRSRAQIAREIRELTENAPASPPPLPGHVRPRSKHVTKTDMALNQRLQHRARTEHSPSASSLVV